MSDATENNCSCHCQYSTPPWWVTMGFSPNNGAAHSTGTVSTTPATPQQPVPANPTGSSNSGSSGNPLSGIGNVLGSVVSGLGGLLAGL